MADKITHLRPVHTGGEPPDMEQRLRHLEQDVAVIKSTMATSAELHSLLRQNIMWSVGTIIGMGALVLAIVRFAGA